MSDELLVHLSRSGDQEALNELIARYERKIYNFCYRVCGNREDAYDLAQDTFLRVCNSIHSFRGDAPLSAWIYRIANNVCVDYIRRQAKSRTISLDAPCVTDDGETRWQIRDHATGPEEAVLYRDLKNAVVEGISRLSPDHKSVIVMHDVQHMTYQHIARALGCPIGTVKSRLNRARFALRQYLEDEGLLVSGSRRETLHIALSS